MNLHYLWVGPPAEGPYQGMDRIGPSLTSKQVPGSSVYFWCLEGYKAHYQQCFSDSPIEVKSIEGYLEECQRRESSLVGEEELLQLQTLLAEKKARALSHQVPADCFREYVTIKVLMQFFLQLEYSGYFLDSNIFPSEQRSPLLCDYPDFRAPILPPRYPTSTDQQASALNDHCKVDPWLMYSPPDDAMALTRFLFYLQEAQQAHESFTLTGKIDRKKLADAMINAATLSLQDEESNFINRGAGTLAQITSHLTVEYLGFVKRYSNSHKHNKASTASVFFNVCTEEDCFRENEVSFYLKEQESITTVLNELLYLNFTNPNRVKFLLDCLSPEKMQELFTESTPFSSYLAEKWCAAPLELLLREYITKCFPSCDNFLKLYSTLLNNASKPQGEATPDLSSQRLDESVSDIIRVCKENPNGLAQSLLDLVTKLGPVIEETKEDYLEELNQVQPSLVSSASYFHRRRRAPEDNLAMLLEGCYNTKKIRPGS